LIANSPRALSKSSLQLGTNLGVIIGFNKLDSDGYITLDESIDVYDSLVEDDDYKYLKSLKCLTKYGDIIDAGLYVYFYPSYCILEGCEIDFNGNLYFTPQPS
jgi:hypothetical protein